MLKNKKAVKRLILAGVAVLLCGLLTALVVVSFMNTKPSREVSVAEAQQIVDTTFENLPKITADGARFIIDSSKVTVKSVEEGEERNYELKCSFTAPDVGGVVAEHKQALIDSAYEFYYQGEQAGRKPNATKICQHLSGTFEELLATAETKTGEVTLYLYEIEEGKFSLYLSDETVNTCTGGLLDARDALNKIVIANQGDRIVDITNANTLRTGVKDFIALVNYDSAKPETGNAIVSFVNDFKDEFYRNFIENARWNYLLQGLGTTLAITGVAGLIGVIIGFIVAIIRCTCQTTGKLKAVDAVCRFYLTVIRGTPVMVQLLIIYFVMLLPLGVPKFTAAVICFGLNSGAYVAEIVRGGIMSVDKGQNEAGRSLGFNFPQTMWYFIVPQAFKAVLPALANEFITLLKESSVAFYIGVADLTQGGLKIRSITYSNFMPLIAVALIYLVIVLVLTHLVGRLERRLRKSDH